MKTHEVGVYLCVFLMVLFVPTLTLIIVLKVVEASASIGARRRFIEALAPTFGRPIEADPVFIHNWFFLA